MAIITGIRLQEGMATVVVDGTLNQMLVTPGRSGGDGTCAVSMVMGVQREGGSDGGSGEACALGTLPLCFCLISRVGLWGTLGCAWKNCGCHHACQ